MVAARNRREGSWRATLAARRCGADIQNREMVQVRVAAGLPRPGRLAPAAQAAFSTGSALAIEVSAAFAGARTVCARSFAPAKHAADLRRAEAVHGSICELARPRASAIALTSEARAIASEAGMELAGMEVVSGIGLDLRQPPQQSDEFESGMFLAVRTALRTARLGAVHRADTVLVTEQGCEMLTAEWALCGDRVAARRATWRSHPSVPS